MFDRLSNDKITNDILKAIIRRTHIILALKQDKEEPEYYEGENFTWNPDTNSPTVTIFLKGLYWNGHVQLWWNGKKQDEIMEVYSNISVDASTNLQTFISIEKTIFDELAEIKKTIPLKELDIDAAFEDEVLDDTLIS